MAFPYTPQLTPKNAAAGLAETIALMRSEIASARHSILGSRRTIEEASAAIARADKILARQISEEADGPLYHSWPPTLHDDGGTTRGTPRTCRSLQGIRSEGMVAGEQMEGQGAGLDG